MAMRDLIPWGRQSSNVPANWQNEETDPIFTLHRNVNRLFDDVFRDSLTGLTGSRGLAAWPSVELQEGERELRVTAEIPGMSDKDVGCSAGAGGWRWGGG